MAVDNPSCSEDGGSTSHQVCNPTIQLHVNNSVTVNVSGDYIQNQVNAYQSSVDKLEVGTPSPTLPNLLRPNIGTSFSCNPGISLEKTLRLTFQHMAFSPEMSERALAQIRNGMCSSCNGRPCTTDRVEEEYSEEFKRKLNDMKSVDEIKDLVKRGFYALVRDNEEQSETILDFINGYMGEENAIESTFYNGRENLKKFLDLMWHQTFYRFVNEICARYEKQSVNIPRVLACIVSKLTKKIPINDTVERAITELRINHKEMCKLGDDFVADKNFLHASIAFFAAGKLALKILDPASAVRKVQTYLHQIRLIVENRVQKPHRCPRAKAVVTEILIPMMRILVQYLRSIKCADLNLQAEKDAWCSGCIAACYSLSGAFPNAIDEIDSALERMRKTFGPNAVTYRVYGMCVNNKGSAFQSIYDFERAKTAFNDALDLYTVVKDWQNPTEKQETIKTAQDNLRQLYQICRAN